MLLEKKTMELAPGVLMHIDPASEFVSLEIEGIVKDKLIRKTDLWGACFLIADAKTQESLIPVQQQEVLKYTRIHTVKLNKDMRKGDTVRVRCEVDVLGVLDENLRATALAHQGKELVIPRK